MSTETLILALTALSIGTLHTLIGPDHYLPFIVMARARRWTLSFTLFVTAVCGVGHVLGSLALGGVAIALGWSLTGVSSLEALRGDLAAWLLIGFGVAYAIWGLRMALRKRPHRHWHSHLDGTVHDHTHNHHGEHAHTHEVSAANPVARSLTPWVLFTIFVLGPCEALIPLLMFPAAQGGLGATMFVAGIFAVATITTMAACVGLGYLGLSQLPIGSFERYAHALAGVSLAVCGLAIQLGL